MSIARRKGIFVPELTTSAKPVNGPFIPAWLDDAGLTTAEFRVVCRIARRGRCFESLTSMAQGCRMRRPTIQRAIKRLLASCIVVAEKRTGKTTVYCLAPSPKGALGLGETQPKTGTRSQPERGTTHPSQKEHYKVSPSEGAPLNGEGRPLADKTDWQLAKDTERLQRQVASESESMTRDPDVLRGLRIQLRAHRAEIARRAPPKPEQTSKPVLKRADTQPRPTHPASTPEQLKNGYAQLHAVLEGATAGVKV